MPRPNPLEAGISLMELMASVAIVAVVVAASLPALATVHQSSRARAAVNILHVDLSFARSAAVTHRTQVVVCPADENNRCDPRARWEHGWMVFMDPDANRQPESARQILRRTAMPGRGISASSTRPVLRYQSDGRSAHSNLTIRICGHGELVGQVVVNNVGRARSARAQRPAPCPHAQTP